MTEVKFCGWSFQWAQSLSEIWTCSKTELLFSWMVIWIVDNIVNYSGDPNTKLVWYWMIKSSPVFKCLLFKSWPKYWTTIPVCKCIFTCILTQRSETRLWVRYSGHGLINSLLSDMDFPGLLLYSLLNEWVQYLDPHWIWLPFKEQAKFYISYFFTYSYILWFI